jgi:hypothetical protein
MITKANQKQGKQYHFLRIEFNKRYKYETQNNNCI